MTGELTVEELARNLASFAIDRTDLKSLMTSLPTPNSLNMTTLEYELGILKILSVGWGIAFYMAATDKNKAALTQTYWEMIREISQNISTLTEATTGTKIDYFTILKERLNGFVGILQENPSGATEPTTVIGPAFASACGSPDDPMAILAGTKMFTLSLGAVKEYLAVITIKDITIH
ncbi:MAG: hypothetical protein CSA29_06060 [Desulfobacterales bacterium]|nr:MAG: hypothetical protein CSA29_06060 [Desulfobacterales bacterium]